MSGGSSAQDSQTDLSEALLLPSHGSQDMIHHFMRVECISLNEHGVKARISRYVPHVKEALID
jgi:hypothetical protein